MASEDKKIQPIIIIRKKASHEVHHSTAWKVALADFMTAMFALFLVMWLVNQDDDIKESVASYFQDPVGFMKGKGQGVLKSGSSPVGSAGKLKDISSVLEMERRALKNIAQQIRQSLEDMPELRGLMEHVEIEVTHEGLRIQLIDSDKDAEANFFDIGSARLKPRTSLLLTAIARELGYLPNFIVVEGHTDSKPFSGRDGYSNWELSSDRANSARKLMENAGLRAGQVVEVRGYADRMLRLPKQPNDPRNRRVAIIALNDEAAKRFSKI